ncbi:MAG: sarcosine oxidase subunit gamma [Pseudomonadota bacterium]
MAEITLKPTPCLGGVDLRIGAIHIQERDDLALICVAIPQEGEAAVADALLSTWDLPMPAPQRVSTAGERSALWGAPDQVLLLAPRVPERESEVAAALDGKGYVTDQTHAWVILEVSGPGVQAAFERLVPLDLDPDMFPAGAAARTALEHMAAIALRLEAERFLLLSASSSARSFLHALTTTLSWRAELSPDG